MARPLRLEFSSALYHVTSRGDRREDIYESDADRIAYLDLLGFVCETFNWVCHAYCLMDNQYHLLIEIPVPQRRAKPKTLEAHQEVAISRNRAIIGAYSSGEYTLKEIGDFYGIHYSTVGGVLKNHKSKT